MAKRLGKGLHLRKEKDGKKLIRIKCVKTKTD